MAATPHMRDVLQESVLSRGDRGGLLIQLTSERGVNPHVRFTCESLSHEQIEYVLRTVWNHYNQLKNTEGRRRREIDGA